MSAPTPAGSSRSAGPARSGRYRGLTAEERTAARRAQLVEAALEVWGREGGPRVTMTLVCAEAGLTERYFYESFGRLEDALAAVLTRVGDRIREEGLRAIAETEGGPTERVRAALDAYVRIMTDDPRVGRVVVLEAPGWPELRAARNELTRSFAALVVAEGRELYGADALPDDAALLQSYMFLGGVQELMTAWLDGTLDATPADIVEAATFMFTRTGHR